MLWTTMLIGCGWLSDPGQAAFDRGFSALRGADYDVTAAATAFEEGCEAGHAESCSWFGVQLNQGRGVPRDTDRALALYDRACDAGVPLGCTNAGNLRVLLAPRIGPDETKAAGMAIVRSQDLGEAACADGDLEACLDLGFLLRDLQQPTKADLVLSKACEKGHIPSCTQRALDDVYSGDARRQDEGVLRLREWCDDGDVDACANLGEWLVATDPAGAVPHLETGCIDGGIGQSCGMLWALHQSDEGGVPAAPERAAVFAERACDLGDAPICVLLAAESEVPRVRTALAEQACWMGWPEGCLLRASLSGGVGPRPLDGRPVQRMDPEPTAALPWYDLACRLSEPRGCAELVVAEVDLNLAPEGRQNMLTHLCRQGLFNACGHLTR